MAPSQPDNSIATAAKVIRIIHENHAAASEFLHKQRAVPGSTRIESRDTLRNMDTDEYVDALEDLDQSQKSSYFHLVARLNEKPSHKASSLDKDTTKKYFKALGLKSKGFSFKDVRKQVKNAPSAVDITSTTTPNTAAPTPKHIEEKEMVEHGKKLNTKVAAKETPSVVQKAPATPAVSQPQKEAKNKKRKREENTPKSKPTAPKAGITSDTSRPSKKPKTESVQPISAPPTDGTSRSQRKRQRLRERIKAKKAAAAANAKPPTTETIPTQCGPGSEAVSKKENTDELARPPSEDVVMENSKPGNAVLNTTPPPESATPSTLKPKKVRRSRVRSKAAKPAVLGADEATETPGSEPSNPPEPEGALTSEGKGKTRRRARKQKASEPAVIESAPVEDEASDDESSVADSGLPSFMRTTLPCTGKPTISAIADPTFEAEPVEEEVGQHHAVDEPTTKLPDQIKRSHSPSMEAMEDAPVEAAKESFLELDVKEKSPGADAKEITSSPAPEPRQISVSAIKEWRSSSSEPQERSLSPIEEVKSSSLVKDTRSPGTESDVSSVSLKVPSVSAQQISRPLKPALETSNSNTAKPSLPLARPLLSNSFNTSQSSFTSARSRSITSAAPKKDFNDSFAAFTAFAHGKKLGYDSSDDDDDDSSSSSSSESEKDEPAPPTIKTVTSVGIQKKHEHEPMLEPSKDEADLANATELAHEVKPSAMATDTHLNIVNVPNEQLSSNDPAQCSEPVDVVMTTDDQNVDAPSEHHESHPFTQHEEEHLEIGDAHIEDVSAENPEKADLTTFQSFHENASALDAPEPSPFPDIPDDLMEFGGYQPTVLDDMNAVTPAVEGERNSEPAGRENHEGTELTNFSKSNDISGRTGSGNEQDMDSVPTKHVNPTEAGGGASIIPESSQLHTEDEQAEKSPRPSSPTSDTTEEEPPEHFNETMRELLAAWSEEQDSFAARIAALRESLERKSDGTAERNKAVLEKLIDEVDREEKTYRIKIEGARKAMEALPNGSRRSMIEVIDRADSSFEQKLILVRSDLEEEYNEECARAQLSPSKEGAHVEMQDGPELQDDDTSNESEAEMHDTQGTQDNNEMNSEPELERDDNMEALDATPNSSAQSNSPALSNATNDWAPSEDEGITESAKQRKKRKTTGAISNHFATPSPKKSRVPAGTSTAPFPKLSAPRFGLVQERLANDPFRLLVAVTFLNKTTGRAAMPIFDQVMEEYPTAQDLASANLKDLSEMIQTLGLQNQRAKKLIKIAETWVNTPPHKGKLYRTRDYPTHGDGRQMKPNDTVDEDVDICAGALEIGHIYGLGPYAWDSWRIFCRDKFRSVADGYNGEGVEGYNSSAQPKDESDFEPEWKRVVPLDKELRACLRWMWLREGWEWDPLTGNKKPAGTELMRKASEGMATWDEPVVLNPHGDDEATAQKEVQEMEGPSGPEALVPGVKNGDASTPVQKTAGPVARVANIQDDVAGETRAKETATPAVPPSSKRLGATPELMTSRLRPRRGRMDALATVSAATPTRRSK